MGLDFNHSEAHWSYGGFMKFRKRLARLDGLGDLMDYDGYGGTKEFPDIPMRDFYDHSDCDGELTPDQMRIILPRFRELIKMMEEENIEDDWDVESATILADDMECCIDENEPMVFC